LASLQYISSLASLYRYYKLDFKGIAWPVADIRLATDIDIPKFAYQYFGRYFNKVF